MSSLRFIPSCLDYVECAEDYRPGGFHPVAIADLFAEGRYRVVHKLGSGGSSTIWLAREQGTSGGLVTIKVMRAELLSNNSIEDVPELSVPRSVSSLAPGANIQTPQDYFMEVGPNGSHLCLVYQLAGPSILSMSFSPGRVVGSRRLRKDLAKKVAKQLACTVGLIHDSGFVHGGSWQFLCQKRD
jgi:serine/threonine-protein kinase SRPK3